MTTGTASNGADGRGDDDRGGRYIDLNFDDNFGQSYRTISSGLSFMIYDVNKFMLISVLLPTRVRGARLSLLHARFLVEGRVSRTPLA